MVRLAITCVVMLVACGGSDGDPVADAAPPDALGEPDAKVFSAADGIPEPGDHFVLAWTTCSATGDACAVPPEFVDHERVYMLDSGARFEGPGIGGTRTETVDAAYDATGECVDLGPVAGDTFTPVESLPFRLCRKVGFDVAEAVVTWDSSAGDAVWTVVATPMAPPE